jgi:peptidoglycan-N-acetylglucosamine deacetylase
VIQDLITILFIIFSCKTIAVLLLSTIQRCKPRTSSYDTNYPGVSVIIPAFNEAMNIEETILSIFKSNYVGLGEIEVVVVDDGSYDSTASIVKRMKKQYENLELVKLNNGGKARALNFGIGFSKHDFVMTVDADSIIDRSAILSEMRYFADPQVAAVAGCVLPSRYESFLQKMQLIEYAFGQVVEKKFQEFFNAVLVIPGAVGVFRKSAVVQSGYYKHDTLTEDMELTLSLLAAGWRVALAHDCRAFTEVPNSMPELLKQRVRWMTGTLQTLWKYRSIAFSRASFLTVYLYAWFFGILSALFFPVLVMVYGMILITNPLLFLWNAILLFSLEMIVQRFTSRTSILAPVQRVFQSALSFFVLIKAVQKLVLKDYSWGKLMREGL